MPDSPESSAPPLRLYLDRHIMTRLADDLAMHGYDCLTTQQAGNDTASDEDQLDFARATSRSILTYNIRDFATLHEQWQSTGRPHAGIIISRQLSGLRRTAHAHQTPAR